jgi:hypothetical protein
MCAAIFLVPPTWDLRDKTQDFGKWLIPFFFHRTCIRPCVIICIPFPSILLNSLRSFSFYSIAFCSILLKQYTPTSTTKWMKNTNSLNYYNSCFFFFLRSSGRVELDSQSDDSAVPHCSSCRFRSYNLCHHWLGIIPRQDAPNLL